MASSQHLRRLEYAWQQVERWRRGSHRKELTQASRGLPAMLRTQGLAVTVATLGKDDRTRPLAEAIARWLLEESPHGRLPDRGRQGGPVPRLLTACAGARRGPYLVAQREALALVELIKTYAEAWDHGKKQTARRAPESE